MQITITAEPKEIADLVVAIQDRQSCENYVDRTVQTITDALSRLASVHTLCS